jgi:1-acyl-sn-glycerol-3-phosphate acyltransferase
MADRSDREHYTDLAIFFRDSRVSKDVRTLTCFRDGPRPMVQEVNETALTTKRTTRNLAVIGLLAAPWVGFLAIALKPSPRQMWAQRWPTISFVGLYQLALDRCVEIIGLEHLPETGPVILAGNHINKTAMDAMLVGSKILLERGGLAKFVSQADPSERMLKHFIRLMGNAEGVILPIHAGNTTETMIEFLRNPAAFKREQPILGIFPAGCADKDFEAHMRRPWHTSAAVAAYEAKAAIVPFFVEGLPYAWGPFDMLKAVARSIVGGKAFEFKIRLGKPIHPDFPKTSHSHADLTERVRQSVLQLAADSQPKN